RQPGPEGVAQRFLPTGGKALRRNEIRVATHRVRLRGGQRESWRRTVETGPKKILTIQRVVEGDLPLVQFGGERVAAVHLVQAPGADRLGGQVEVLGPERGTPSSRWQSRPSLHRPNRLADRTLSFGHRDARLTLTRNYRPDWNGLSCAPDFTSGRSRVCKSLH